MPEESSPSPNPEQEVMRMTSIPLSIVKYIRSLWMSEMILTYFHLDPEGLLVRWGGHPWHYGLRSLNTGRLASEQIAFLEGLLPVTHTQVLEFVTIEQGKVAHVHLIPFDAGTWVLMFDATAEHERQQKMQQRANELSILTYRQTRLLQDLEETRVALLAEKQLLEQAGQQKSDLIASLSHELRSPLTSLIGYTDLLAQMKAADTEEKQYLNGVRSNVSHLLHLVDNVLNQASLETEQLQLHSVTCDMRYFVQELNSLFLPTAKEKDLALIIKLAPSVPPRLRFDELRFRQVLINLIANALKFTDHGSINVQLQWESDYLQFTVTDTGPGIDSAAREKIFHPFHREENTAQQVGNGLGLSITRQLVELMGGFVSVCEAPNPPGSQFSGQILAPMVQMTHALPTDMPSNTAQGTILVAEDCAMIHTLIELYLTEAGYSVLSANDGDEALALAQQHTDIDLMLVDLHMPKQDGDVVVKQLREDNFTKPIIAMSASEFSQDRLYALSCGCDDYLTKPIDMPTLLAAIMRHLPPTPAVAEQQ